VGVAVLAGERIMTGVEISTGGPLTTFADTLRGEVDVP
jgi:hypothetical protein